MADDTSLRLLRIQHVADLAVGIRAFDLRAPDGTDLPPFTAGAHVAVRTPAGSMRHYSLCNDPAEAHRYVIAVKREADGRGGSRSLFDDAPAGATLEVGVPENAFALDDRAKSFLLIAGGIGITPIMAMVRSLAADGTRRFRLVYLTRDAASTAFADTLAEPEFRPHVTVHHDAGDPARTFDLWPLLEKPGATAGQHVYCCGPKPLMDAVRDMTGHWPPSAVHFETFGGETAPRPDDLPFEVRLERTGVTLAVPVGRSILDVARQHGVRVPSSCESGTCGSCRTRLLAGEADHRDLVLLDEERGDQIMVCVSRARSPRLVVDL